ncbi:MAG: family 10 glycosylhydrolase [Acidobacteriota bacterium]|nr:family 10 glycosylhydrolase [Acidobacteriota bacterium]MDQ3374598.1 family 10 glycosylhydrolase [Acidobacteriota bacterium]
MLKTRLLIIICSLLLCISVRSETLPKPTREFRAVWIATVANIDFPTKKTLSVEEQKAELIRDLDLARQLRLNAVVFQVRPMCDALYDSKIEPWSEFLTGAMGKPQSFDPLQFVIEEAHRRGILVHAWFNPYRAFHPSAKTVSENHISKRRPDLVRKYGKYLWLDPSDREVQKYSLSVILDVVRRYDVDGIHFDDYFYPYPEKDADGNKIEFPDDANWRKYKNAGGKLTRDDWRRKNVDDFIESVGRESKRIKPFVLYGISPFGIWQPVPEKNIKGLNAFTELYADAKKWLQNGTIDYLAPQLYWETARKEQSFPVLLEWWQSQNVKNRHLWTGIAPYRIGSNTNYTAAEIINQIETTRRLQPTAGNIKFSFKSVRNDLGNLQQLLKSGVYKNDAIVPASNWIKTKKPAAPKIEIKKDASQLKINWREQGKVKAFWFVVYAKDRNGWSHSILPRSTKSIALSATRQISQIVVTGVDRLGNESLARHTILKR